MSGYAVAHLDEIDEMDDGRCPWRPVRHHFGITAFGVNAWTARDSGDRIINEHDESDESNEELYVVLRGRATFDLANEVIFKEAHLAGIFGRRMWRTWEQATALLRKGLDVAPVITHRLPIERFEEAFSLLKAATAGKVILYI